MIIPDGVSQADFSKALQQFENAIGKEWVFTEDADVALYKDAYSPLWGEDEEIVASAAVAPHTTEEVQAIMRIAHQHKIPIYPISTGKNLGYGGSAPVLSKSVVLDLKRMDRILEVDDVNHSALVEPGVSYFDLYHYIQEKGYKVWIDCPDPGWGSLMGNALDHGCGYTTSQFRDHFGAHCGMEVVLANGELLRTGMGALPGAKTWQQYHYGYGPFIDGLFSQGNFGVVTKMGFRLMPEPEAYLTGKVTAYNREDIIALVAIQQYLENSNICNGLPDFNSPILSTGAGGISLPTANKEHAEIMAVRGPPPVDALARFGRNYNIPYWELELRFYGPEKVIKEQWSYAKEQFKKIKGAQLHDGVRTRFPISTELAKSEREVHFGIPNLAIFFIGARSEYNPNPDTGHLWFSPMIPRTGEALLESQAFFGQALHEHGIDLRGWDVTPANYFRHAFLLLFGFPVKHDVETNRNTRAAFRQIVKLAAEKGWGEYRTAPAFMDDVMNAYSFNNNILRRFNETIKDAVDPNGIISAGRSGIWPKHLRKS